MSFSAFAEVIYGEKPNSFVLQCPSKYKIDDDTAKFFYQYNAKAEVLFITGYSTRLGFFRRFTQMADLSLTLVKTLDFGFGSQPDITIYRETLKIESPFNDDEAQCELVSFEYYLKGVNEKGFAICPQIDRSSPRLLNIKWLLNFPYKINSINYKNISKSISKEMGKKYAGHYTLNAGCFGYSKNYDGLSVIHKNLKEASKKGRIFGTDQVALALSAFEDKLDFEFLPSYCNWICEHSMPKFCESREVFVEPYVPHHNIALIHLAGLDNDRQNRDVLHEIVTLSGNKIKKSLRYPS